jgi:hypothetical protein
MDDSLILFSAVVGSVIIVALAVSLLYGYRARRRGAHDQAGVSDSVAILGQRPSGNSKRPKWRRMVCKIADAVLGVLELIGILSP